MANERQKEVLLSRFNAYPHIKLITNAGLILLQNVSKIFPSSFVSFSAFNISEIILLPIGKPHNRPINNG